MDDRERLRAARQRLANLLVRGPGSDSPERYEAVTRLARADVERAERSLGQRSPQFSNEDTQARRGLSDVLAALPPRWGVVAYASCTTERGREYVAFVMGPGRAPQALRIGDAKPVDRLIRRWAADILSSAEGEDASSRRDEASARKSGTALRVEIWDPIAAALGTVEGVFVVPDGALHAVSLAALPRSGGGYLAEDDMLLQYLSSEWDIVAFRRSTARGTGLLAMGGVAFGSTSGGETRQRTDAEGVGGESAASSTPTSTWDCTGFRDVRFAPLPQSEFEVREIASNWAEPAAVTVVTGSDATEVAFKRLAPGKRVIHLATHGFFLDPDRCLPSGAGSRGIGGIETAVRQEAPPTFSDRSPLLLSGVALAAANLRSRSAFGEEDGILTAEEVASLDLRGVEWAVLSACDTGMPGAAGGEGILGLRRAFQTAGVSTLVISLWPVQDQAARAWMRALYHARIQAGMGTAQSIRAAMLEVLQSRRAQGRSTNPFYWAAFLAAGDWK